MDPDVAFQTMLTTTDDAERHDAADALEGWLLKGGFMPETSHTRADVLGMCRAAITGR